MKISHWMGSYPVSLDIWLVLWSFPNTAQPPPISSDIGQLSIQYSLFTTTGTVMMSYPFALTVSTCHCCFLRILHQSRGFTRVGYHSIYKVIKMLLMTISMLTRQQQGQSDQVVWGGEINEWAVDGIFWSGQEGILTASTPLYVFLEAMPHLVS